jgi:hypothetical protein
MRSAHQFCGRISALVLLLLCCGVEAAAQNLVVDADFDTAASLDSWPPGIFSLPEWIPDDWQADPRSGSMRLHNFASCGGTFSSQCIELPEPHAPSYDFGLAISLEGTLTASAVGKVLTVDGPSCQGNAAVLTQAIAVYPPSGWLAFFQPRLMVPSSTRSILIVLSVQRWFLPGCVPSGTAVARFDDVRFGPAGTTPVSLHSFSVE